MQGREPGIEISKRDLAVLGLHRLAYVKPVRNENDVVQLAICAADGTRLATMDNRRDLAFAAIRQHDLEPVSVH